ncbi:MAG: insulinase family protein [Ignavibacteriae bacterium]|nr:insulinase family protein [Ignavibacteriota bacterium]
MKRLPLISTLFLFAMALITLFHEASQGAIRITEIHSSNSPLVTFRVVLRAGEINSPAGKEGLNALTAYVIAQGGTQELSYQQVVEKLYPWAANINVQVDQEITTFIGTVHRDHLDAFYKLFTDLLLHPRFDESDFSRVKDLGLNYLKNSLRSTSDEQLGKQALNTMLYANHPYKNTEFGTVQGLTTSTLDDVKAYYKKTYTQGNFWFGIAGGYPKSLIEKIKTDFSMLPEVPFSEVTLPKPEPINNLEVMVVEKPARAFAISMGHPLSLTRKEKDFYALLVANSYFGEHRTFNGVLMNRLRGDRGLNYGDYSYVEKFVGGVGSGNVFPELNTPLRQQFFSIWLRPVQPENTHFAIRNALFEFKNFVEQGLSKEDFEKTKKFVLNYSKLWAGTLSRRLGYQMDSEFYGTEYFIDRIDKELKSLSVEEVNAAVKKYLDYKNVKIAVVVDEGKGNEIMNSMISNMISPIKYASPVSPNILEQDKFIEAFQLSINKEESKVVKANELFEK